MGMSEFITWDQFFSLPPPGNMMPDGAKGIDAFIATGNRIAGVIAGAVTVFLPSRRTWQSINMLDFGCGNGRVALPLNWHYGRLNFCCDVDRDVVERLAKNLPNADVVTSAFEPPTRYSPDFFDVIYSISVFTHLPEKMQTLWLKEFLRILKPGGIALISTSGYRALSSRRDIKKLEAWVDVSDKQLAEEGMVFRQSPRPPGVIGEYGYAAHAPNWVRNHWGKDFLYLGCWERAVDGIQDLHIMSKPLKQNDS